MAWNTSPADLIGKEHSRGAEARPYHPFLPDPRTPVRGKMRRRMNLSAGITGMMLAIAAIGSCSAMTMKGYTGAHLPTTRVAVIESGAYTQIDKCDGIKLNSYSLNIAVKPGTHTIEMAFLRRAIGNRLLYSIETGSVTFVAQEGHRYQVYTDAIPESKWIGLIPTQFVWIGYVKDKTSGEYIARTDPLPLKAEHISPEYYSSPSP
jgi:hypothetical protein